MHTHINILISNNKTKQNNTVTIKNEKIFTYSLKQFELKINNYTFPNLKNHPEIKQKWNGNNSEYLKAMMVCFDVVIVFALSKSSKF